VSDQDKERNVCLGELDEDEGDRREMEEIQQRMKERKSQKELERGRTSASVAVTATSSATSTSVQESRKMAEMSRKFEETVTATRRATKKSSAPQAASSTEDANQREEAIEWASETTSGTNVAKIGVSNKKRARLKSIKKAATVDVRPASDASESSLAVQEFMAMQYPPFEELVSSPLRLGKALVSDAFGMRTDDPRLFATAVRLPECTIVLHSTKSKAKVPVSAPPPNSIESDMEVNDVEDVQLSQSTTDIGVHIELPDGEIELIPQEVSETEDDHSVRDISLTDAPVVPGIVSTPMMSHFDLKTTEMVGENTGEINQAEKDPSNAKVVGAACDKVTTESQRMMKEIDGAKLLQDELIQRDTSLASISSFLNTVCSGTARGKKTEEIEET